MFSRVWLLAGQAHAKLGVFQNAAALSGTKVLLRQLSGSPSGGATEDPNQGNLPMSAARVGYKFVKALRAQERFTKQLLDRAVIKMEDKISSTVREHSKAFDERLQNVSEKAKKDIEDSGQRLHQKVDHIESKLKNLESSESTLKQKTDQTESKLKDVEYSVRQSQEKIDCINPKLKVLDDLSKSLSKKYDQIEQEAIRLKNEQAEMRKSLWKIFSGVVVAFLGGGGYFVIIPRLENTDKKKRPMTSAFQNASDTDYDRAISSTRSIVEYHDVCEARHDFELLINRLEKMKDESKTPDQEGLRSYFPWFVSDRAKISERISVLQEEKTVYDTLCKKQEDDMKKSNFFHKFKLD